MAVEIARQWGLTVLRVRLDVASPDPAVEIRLLTHEDRREKALWVKRFAVTEFGLTDVGAPTRSDALHLPPNLVGDTARALWELVVQPGSLWLHLVPPHGFLGAIPWEHHLVAGLGMPVLRVPDRFPVAVDPGRTWTTAIVASVGTDERLQSHLCLLVEKIQRLVTKVPLEVHLFADKATTRAIGSGRAALPGVEVHDPEEAEHLESATPARAWTRWLTTGLRGRAASAVHFVGRGILDGKRPLLAIAQTPASVGQGCLSGSNIAALADSVGASALSFSSPQDRQSDVAIRMLANSVGFERSGPTLYADTSLDPGGMCIAAVYAFLASPSLFVHPFYGPAGWPSHEALFAFVQPDLVLPGEDNPLPPLAAPAGTAPADHVRQAYIHAERLPGWVATSERFVDTKVGDLVRSARIEAPVASTKQAYDEGTLRGLAELRSILDQQIPRSQ